ncbi:LuxR C-terminal-related transcriptional regulator [Phenylobacterium sp. LH3H17]|uniref:alpha/beta fold hydrolase n=1 Tax=Phenylobacterium sp. LH3H17 TaxID=2903901 RepID=UPI0020C9B47C|nr:alpha/beta fold hydrolase [Phenylobacterium sp. LH3H17]UTP40210.1 LuxR C-terminal-related transcriptional regulator [Phenylobacterium sp. LH3H17]
MDAERDAKAALVIEAMYRIAADLENWEQLIDALGAEGEDEDPSVQSIRDLAHSEDIARLLSRADEGPGAGHQLRRDIGWMVLSPQGRAIAANPAAHAVIEDGLGQLRLGDAPAFSDPANGEALTQALGQARGLAGGRIILKLQRDAEEGPRFAYLIPARDLPGGVGPAELAEDAFAVVFPAIEETGRLWAAMRESFGLTAAEVRLAVKLRDGRTLKEAADELEVSVNTVRNQLRAIFDKMGLNRQSDLIRALTELSAVANAMDAAGPEPQIAHPVADAPTVRSIVLGDGRRLAYRDYGDPDGRAILSFHEGLGSSLMPPGTHGLARELGLRIISAERPGFGQSDPRPDYSFDGVAQDMVELCDRLELRKLQIGALLSGAPSALQTAIRLGSRVTQVHLYSGRPPRRLENAPRSALAQFRARIESNPWVVETLFAVLRLRNSPAQVEKVVRRSIAHSPSDRAFVEAHPEVLPFISAYVAEALARTSRGPADEVRAFRRGQNQTISALRAPLVVWHGAEDVMAPLPDLLAFLGDTPHEVRIKPGIGHLLALKHWEEILRDAAA